MQGIVRLVRPMDVDEGSGSVERYDMKRFVLHKVGRRKNDKCRKLSSCTSACRIESFQFHLHANWNASHHPLASFGSAEDIVDPEEAVHSHCLASGNST